MNKEVGEEVARLFTRMRNLIPTLLFVELTMKQIYDKHNVGKPYLQPNYKEVLANFEAEGRIIANPPANQRRKRRK